MTNLLVLHPAISTLLKNQATSRLNRIVSQLRNPRRLVLSIAAALLAFIWIGQAVASIFLREAAEPVALARYVCFSLVAYALWNSLKVCLRKPAEAFEWTETERELLLASPLPRVELIKFRFATILGAALLKATVFTVVMLPDLALIPAGFVGVFLGLVMIDILRIGLEIFVGGLNQSTQWRLRAVVALATFGSLFLAFSWTLANTEVMKELSTAGSLGFVFKLAEGLTVQADTVYGSFVVYPFLQATRLILATQWSWESLQIIVSLVTAVVLGCGAIVRLDNWMNVQLAEQARASFLNAENAEKLQRNVQASAQASVRRRQRRINFPNAGGLGALCQRQLLGAWRYRKSLIFAIGVPFVLCCLPAMSDVRGILLVGNVVAAVVFYSFLLLPTSFKFDFRRDVERLALLKSLPITPFRLVLGQIAAPILITTLFQVTVLLVAYLLNPSYPSYFLGIAMSALLPLNVCIFGFENLVFLYFPHRMNQEGLHVFVRTILAFTAKGLLFALGIGAVVAWYVVANSLTQAGWLGSIHGGALFTAGLIRRTWHIRDGNSAIPFLRLRTI